MLNSFRVAIFLGAGLLFVVQPLFAKMVLPRLGGSPAVWNTCMLFFQGMLLAGYAYAHFSRGLPGQRSAIALHLVLLVVVLFLPALSISSDWTPPDEGTPIFWLLGLLLVVVGAPFFAVSATGPLLQHWFSLTTHDRSGNPYFLYAASNAGSMLALLAYPFLIERFLPLETQAWLWKVVYAGFVALMAVCAFWVLWSARQRGPESATKVTSLDPGALSPNSVEGDSPTRVSWKQRLLWVGLSFVPSSWMLGVTSFLTTDITPMPVLWIIPLTLYLVTFVIAFAERDILPVAWLNRAFPVAMLILVATTILQGGLVVLLLHLAIFFVGALTLHAELARRKPSALHLTEFYLWISIGGLLGGVLNGLIAPLLFPWILEYPLTLMLACALCPSFDAEDSPRELRQEVALKAEGRGRNPKKKNRKKETEVNADSSPPTLLANVRLVGILLFGILFALLANALGFQGTATLILATLGGLALLCLLWLANRPLWFAFPLGAVLILAKLEPPQPGETVLYTGRSYFGVNRVVNGPRDAQRRLYHGTTVHGIQSTDPDRPELDLEPLTYYHRTGPLGMIFENAQQVTPFQRIGVVGLGAGTMASYHRPGQRLLFFEIDPIVKAIAEDPDYFTFLTACGEENYEIILGDGRLQLARQPDQTFDLLVFDAFSSDAIPIHLLTREALALYRSKLTGDGFLAFHISNLHFDLEPILGDLASDLGWQSLTCHDRNISEQELIDGKAPASYVIISPELRRTGLENHPQWQPTRRSGRSRVWTDNFSNLFDALK